MERGTDGNLQVYQPADGGVSGTQSECDTLRPAQHRQDLYGTLVCTRTPQCRVCGLLTSKDEACIGQEDSTGVWCRHQRQVSGHLRGSRVLPALYGAAVGSVGRSRGFAVRGVFGTEGIVERNGNVLWLVYDGSRRTACQDKQDGGTSEGGLCRDILTLWR